MLASAKIIIYLYFFFVQYISICAERDYCEPNICNSGKRHILCQYPLFEASRDCINHERTIKSKSDKQRVLNKINTRRNKVAAGEIRSLRAAENMLKLEWNEELAVFAQRWADQCINHSLVDVEDSCRDLYNSSVGQNIATIYGDAPGLTPIALVDLWYMELLNVNASIISQYQPSTITGMDSYDYFTQLIWAETSQVGCGAVKFKERISEESETRTVYRLVCNFAPAGNQVGKTVYANGVPCSRCPSGGSCNSVYKALCDQFQLTTKSEVTEKGYVTQMNSNIQEHSFSDSEFTTLSNKTLSNSNVIKPSLAPNIDYDNSTAFDYFSELFDSTTRPSVSPVGNSTLCKDMLLVDELLELLKKKLSSDQTFRELLFTTKSSRFGNTDGTFTDPSIVNIISNIYRKEEYTTTARTTESAHINSTLLVDLVEAVIFRNNDKIPTLETPDFNAQTVSDVIPVKIQAELAEIRANSDFTGHYFFPEEDNDQASEIKTDTYYDASNIPISDVALEIEELRRNKVTKDFLDEILESDFITENATKSIYNDFSSGIGNKHIKIFKKDIPNTDHLQERVRRHVDSTMAEQNSVNREKRKSIPSFISYEDLLKKLAGDIKLLKLNRRFHCAQNYSVRRIINIFLLLTLCFVHVIFKLMK